MLLGVQMTRIGTPAIRVKTRDTKRFQERFQLLTRVGLVQQEDTTRTALLAAAVPLLALSRLAMADNISALTVEPVQDLDDHDATQSHGVAELQSRRG
jgi:hypothetical protein